MKKSTRIRLLTEANESNQKMVHRLQHQLDAAIANQNDVRLKELQNSVKLLTGEIAGKDNARARLEGQLNSLKDAEELMRNNYYACKDERDGIVKKNKLAVEIIVRKANNNITKKDLVEIKSLIS